MVKRILLAATALTVAGMMGATPANAQDWPDYRVDFGINAGGSWYTASLDDEHLTTDENARLEPGWLFGTQLTFWLTDRFGIRANGAYSERPLILGDIGPDSDSDLLEDINVWSASGDILFRLGDGYSMGGIWSRPYFAAGVGVKQWNPAVEHVEGDYNVTDFYVENDEFAVVDEFKIMGLLGLGTDFRLARNFAIRTELGARFWDSPMRGNPEFQFDPDEDLGKVVIEPYLQLGAHILLGLEAPEVVAVEPPPPAPAPVERGGEEPEPVEEEIVVCVVDPSAANGLVEVNAIYLPATRDTMVMEGEMRRDFATVVPRVTVANEADWFVRGEPLQIAIAEDATLEYTTWQSARMIPATQLTYLGTARGLPVYAASDDVAEVAEQMAEAREASMEGDLDEMMEQNAELAAALEDVQYLYVPLRPTGCVFQAVRQIEQVRKK